MKFWLILFIFFVGCPYVIAQQPLIEGKFYPTSKGETIYLPIGKISFADKVINFNQGTPKASEEFSLPAEALGEPNYVHYKVPNYISLGCGGQLVLEFTDNGFIDMPGPDLYVWEVGPSKESFRFEISNDGIHWLDLGIIEGGKSYIDISEVVTDVEDVFYFVRITDQKDLCSGKSPGVDIDAVGTISGVLKINLSGDVLFDTAKHILKKEALETIDSLASKIQKVGIAKIVIEGHTDNVGGARYNQKLSERRAQSVLNRLQSQLENQGVYEFEKKAYGLTKPRTTNHTEEGKQNNRRVEIVVLPHRDFYKNKD